MEQIGERLLSWASILGEETREQAVRTSTMPFVFPHVALMPDAHFGKGATVGSVIPALGALIPAAVGVDIGCGMIAVRTGATRDDVADLDADALRRSIERRVPLSPGRYNDGLYDDRTEAYVRELEELDGAESAERVSDSWRRQLGSLGGGNHFIEVCTDEQDRVWLFLHSGSRGVGNRLATHHIEVAARECRRWWIRLPDPDLAYLVEGTDEFGAYLRDLRWAQRFAFLNRAEMMNRVRDAFAEWTRAPVHEDAVVDCHHNYTEQERHFGKTVWLSRKGAIDASAGTWGLVPGSMGTASYVVQGKGNRLALDSSPHGAGRNHSRARARKLFTHADLRARMTGISWRDSTAFLDEHPDAYKDIDRVMADAADLVEVRHTLRQFVNVKGE
jgi:tRNA-splicing ligase RtcB